VMSAVDTAVIHPRRKLGQAKLGRGTQAVLLNKRDLESLMHLRLSGASKQLGISATTVKKVCRTLGIYKWGNASLREHCADTPGPSPRSSSSDAPRSSSSDASLDAQDTEHTRHKPHFNGVPAPIPVAFAMYIDSSTPPKLEHASSRAQGHALPGFFPAPTLAQSAIDVASDSSEFTSDMTSWSGVHHTICAARVAATPEMPPSLVEPFSDIESDDDFASIARCDPNP